MAPSILTELYKRNRLLAVFAWLHAGLFAATLLLMVIDDREVLGINTWIKPAKFMASLAIYLWTVAWFSKYIAKPRWRIRAISIVIAVVITIETACILLQAGRGTTSHFNTATDFDGMIFTLMGVMIGIDMLMMVIVLAMFRKPSVSLPPSYLWAIRLGIVMFLFGGWIGGEMIGNQAHSVGAADGGPGLPLVNWSTTAGDLRIAHGLALHALQILPLLGYLISRWEGVPSPPAKQSLVVASAAAYAYAVVVLFRQAIDGVPMITG